MSDNEGRERRSEQPEMTGTSAEVERRPPEPRIYVASLSDYNAGRLHGRWIDAAQEVEGLEEDIQGMLRSSPTGAAEEWAIHDYQGFGSFEVSEYEALGTVARIAQGTAEHGPAFAALASLVGTESEDELERFDDYFLGQFDSMEDFARGLAEDLGWEDDLDRIAGNFRAYVDIDYEMLGRDLATELSTASAPEGGVYVFDLRS